MIKRTHKLFLAIVVLVLFPVIILLLPNNHTSGTKPGLPTPKAAVADNDLALGKIVEAVSNSKFWKETCIFVTEDDPQAGLDHVDGHRIIWHAVKGYDVPYPEIDGVNSGI